MEIAEEPIVDTLFKDITKRLFDFPGQPGEANGCTIFRVPAHIRRKHKDLYEPLVVSIGPYHHSNKDLRAMKEHKWRYLRDFLSRHPGSHFLKACIKEIKAMEPRSRMCYFESFDLDSSEFTHMMLLDGCFILEFLLKRINGEVDTIIEVTWNWNLIKNDMLMLENQIPFFVLQKLFELSTKYETNYNGQHETSISSIINHSEDLLLEILIQYLMWGEMKITAPISGTKIHHLLHLYHLCFVPTPMKIKHKQRSILKAKSSTPKRLISLPLSYYIATLKWISSITISGKKESMSGFTRSPGSILSATKLLEAGVTLKKKSSFNFLDITFRDGILRIPFLSLDETKKSRFMNLIALEQCSKMERNMASYAIFMGCLVDTQKDVMVLQEYGLIDNMLANNEEAALFLNQLANCASVDYEKHYLAELFKEINAYCQSDWNKWRAKLLGEYFNSPWAILSVVAAFILLVLTFLQSYFAMYSYYHPSS